MALEITIVQDDGIPCTYHRVVRVETLTNVLNTIEVAAYPSLQVREMEVSDNELRAQGERVDRQVYAKAHFYTTDYKSGMSIADAYDYLKTLPEYLEAKDNMEVVTSASV